MIITFLINLSNISKKWSVILKVTTKKSKKKIQSIYKTISTILKEQVDTFMTLATTSTSITLSVGHFGTILKPVPNEVACGLTLSTKVFYEIIMAK